jgi:outer membrane protein TolC
LLPQRQRLVEETLRQYNAMNASSFELLSTRRDLVEAGRQYIDATRRFWRASARARALARGAMPGVEMMESPTTGRSASAGAAAPH